MSIQAIDLHPLRDIAYGIVIRREAVVRSFSSNTLPLSPHLAHGGVADDLLELEVVVKVEQLRADHAVGALQLRGHQHL